MNTLSIIALRCGLMVPLAHMLSTDALDCFGDHGPSVGLQKASLTIACMASYGILQVIAMHPELPDTYIQTVRVCASTVDATYKLDCFKYESDGAANAHVMHWIRYILQVPTTYIANRSEEMPPFGGVLVLSIIPQIGQLSTCAQRPAGIALMCKRGTYGDADAFCDKRIACVATPMVAMCAWCVYAITTADQNRYAPYLALLLFASIMAYLRHDGDKSGAKELHFAVFPALPCLKGAVFTRRTANVWEGIHDGTNYQMTIGAMKIRPYGRILSQ